MVLACRKIQVCWDERSGPPLKSITCVYHGHREVLIREVSNLRPSGLCLRAGLTNLHQTETQPKKGDVSLGDGRGQKMLRSQTSC